MGLIESTAKHVRHFTVTGYVMNSDRTKLLMIHHNKLGKWLPAGGHLEENEVPHEGAIREVLEETGVTARPVTDSFSPDLGLKGEVDMQIPHPYALLYQLIPESSKDKEHIHLDMVYALEADENTAINAQLLEVKDARWLTKDEILAANDVFDSAKGFARLNLK
jgi:8-oxo-dGTP diphosphatase